ncbi:MULTISPECIES: TadE/TadG family type IV pilus assembly protein [Alphaproteobacteria]|uniref:TadE/TadG family type IV pilus assembly protein n=1 Tax=Alphaproteobacteria TaxID=28211 RepID=UPI001F18D371|nr:MULTISPECIES: TadE/TadG family type IV pilus assembly protein [Alphaproteobacteria]
MLRRFLGDRRGVGGVEFALLAPVLIVLYLCAFELTMGLSVSKKVTMAASTVADIVSRSDKVAKSDLEGMVDVTNAIFVPYGVKNLSLKITGISIDSSKQAKVAWSWSHSGTAPYAVGATVSVPSDMLMADTFLVRSELSVDHELVMYLPALSGSQINKITIGREFFFRQRINTDITCSDC